MKPYILLLFSTTILLARVNAQKITIVSGHTQKPLPFATIKNITGKWAEVSSDKGVVVLSNNFQTGDSLVISYTGYRPIRLQKPTTDLTLVMEPMPEMLKPVEVFPCKGQKPYRINNFKKNKSDWFLGSNEEALASWAAYIPNEEGKKGIISTISFKISQKDIPDSAWKAPLKVKLLTYDEATALPSTPLLEKEIVVYPQSKKVTLNMAEEWIRLPKKGFVVAIDFFFAGNNYLYTGKVREYKGGGIFVDTLKQKYGSSIEAVRGNDIIGYGYIYNYKRNEWQKSEKYTAEGLAPKLEIEIKECE